MSEIELFIGYCIFIVNSGKAQLVLNSSSLVIEPGGSIEVKGDIIANSSIVGNGKVVMNGTEVQSILMNGNTIPNLEVSNTSNVIVDGNLSIGKVCSLHLVRLFGK